MLRSVVWLVGLWWNCGHLENGMDGCYFVSNEYWTLLCTEMPKNLLYNSVGVVVIHGPGQKQIGIKCQKRCERKTKAYVERIG